MTGRSSRRSARDDSAELRAAIERLTDQVRLLVQVADELLTEIQWHNNQHSGFRPSSPFRLTSMPIDPAAEDWQINRLRAADLSPLAPDTKAARPQMLFE